MTTLIIDTETTGLDPLKDEILCIGMHDGENVQIFSTYGAASGKIDEKLMLKRFWTYIESIQPKNLVGFNFDFDWTFLKLRSLKHGIKIRHFEKYTERTDLRLVLNSNAYQKGTKLSDYCAFLGIEDGDCIEGAQVPELWKAGEYEKVTKHLEHDVRKTAELYRRMIDGGLL